MSYDEYSGWMEYYGLEPFGGERGEMQNALLCSVVANSMGVNGTKPQDFLIFTEKQEEQEDWAVNLLNAMQRV